MSKYTDSFFAMTAELAPATAGEAARLGHERLEPEHLLLGVIAQGGPAAELLAEHGVTLDTARKALRDTDRALLAAVGIEAPSPVAGLPLEAGDLRWTAVLDGHLKRADRFRKAQGAPGLHPQHVLQALLEDEGGACAHLLRGLGADLADLRARLAVLPVARTPHGGAPSGQCFVPVAPDRVWPLLADAGRIACWHPATRVERLEGSGGHERQRWHELGRGDRPLVVERRVERFEPGRAIGWRTERMRSGDRPWRAPRGVRRFVVELEPVSGGTRIRVAFTGSAPWWGRPLRPLFRPVVRVAAGQWARALGAAAQAG